MKIMSHHRRGDDGNHLLLLKSKPIITGTILFLGVIGFGSLISQQMNLRATIIEDKTVSVSSSSGGATAAVSPTTASTSTEQEPPPVYYKHNNSVTYESPKQCTEKQYVEIEKQLPNSFRIERLSACHQPSWITDFYLDEDDKVRLLEDGNGRRPDLLFGGGGYDDENDDDVDEYFLGISVGCNKAYDAIDTARMGMLNPKFDKVQWRDGLDSLNLTDRGACSQRYQPQFILPSNAKVRRGEMHCIEPVPATIQSITKLVQEQQLNQEGFIVTGAAISSRDGTILFPKGTGAGGNEMGGLNDCFNPKLRGRCENVPMYSLQTYVEQFVKGYGPINILSIDVEGFDFDVLFGAGSVLDRTQYLEFEVNQWGNWAQNHLGDAVRLLNGKQFTCYIAGQNKLWRITNCMRDLYETHRRWSNVACVHRSQMKLAQRMEELFLKGISSG